MTGADTNSRDSRPDACRRFRVSGHVQGVFFRASTQTTALDLGLSGHAINKPDGTVEVLACGTPAALDELARWLHHGPPMAQVTEVTATPCAYREIDGFTTA